MKNIPDKTEHSVQPSQVFRNVRAVSFITEKSIKLIPRINNIKLKIITFYFTKTFFKNINSAL